MQIKYALSNKASKNVPASSEIYNPAPVIVADMYIAIYIT